LEINIDLKFKEFKLQSSLKVKAKFNKIKIFYSYNSATAGSSLAALLAGQIPKNKPTMAENVTDPKIAVKGIAIGHS
jgi:hypothetical protein